MKKKTILKMFTIPLVFIVLLQALIGGLPLLFGNITEKLSEYSVNLLNQTVTTRKIIIENNMIQNWSNISDTVDQVNIKVEQKLMEENITINEFLENNYLQSEVLDELLSTCLYTMRKNIVTGSFLVLGAPDGEAEEYYLNGVYFRDTDPFTNSPVFSDVMMERGDSKFSKELNIPLDVYWKSQFTLKGLYEREEDFYFYKPYQAAVEHPDIGYMDLGYWSKAFCMEGNYDADAYQMITYSVPLIYEDGSVYGVFGVEISIKHLEEMLPAKEIGGDGQSGYVIGQFSEEGLIPVAYTGVTAARNMLRNTPIPLSNMSNNDLYLLDDKQIERRFLDNEKAVTSMQKLRLYNTNTPFAEEQWVVCGLLQYDNLFGFGQTIVISFTVGLVLALGFAVISITILVRKLTKPIMNLSDCIISTNEKTLEDFKESNIVEIDQLFHVVKDLTDTQAENAYRLTEEKERYKAVLQSRTDVLFTLDCQVNTLELMNMNEAKGDLEETFVEDFEKWILENDMIHPEHQREILDAFHNLKDNNHLEVKSRNSANKPYRWVAINGKAVYDQNGNLSKVIGSTQDIHEQKEEELRIQNRNRVDSITGLYKRKTGEEMIVDRLNKGAKGSLVLLDIDRFYLINETYGIIVGDAILEEIGKLIMGYLNALQEARGIWGVGMRAGGDEMLIWIEGMTSSKVLQDMEMLQNSVQNLYSDSNLILSLSGGITDNHNFDMEFSDLFLQVQQAIAYAKENTVGNMIVYTNLSELQMQTLQKKSIDDIISVTYDKRLSIVSVVFNFFDKGGELGHILPILLMKLGRHFQAKAIIMVQIDRDFRAVYNKYRWTEQKDMLSKEQVHHFKEERFAELISSIGGEEKVETFLENISDEEARFLGVSVGDYGISIPMYDNNQYFGSMSFVQKENELSWTKEEQKEIQEIAKIVETNFNKEKHDMASRAKSEFLSRMSHEMRTPMNAIIGMAEIALTQKEEPQKVENSLNKIKQSSNYLLHLINDVLDMSKIESGKMKLVYDNIYLPKLMEDICQLMEAQVKVKKIQFQSDIKLCQEWVVGDALHLQQVLVNLLSNAVKFTPVGGEIIFLLHQTMQDEQTSELFFSVKDTGIGVNEESKKKIFHSFEQADDQVSRQYGGTGLGLAISGHLVSMMGGIIELESEVGKGSNFYFRLVVENGIETVSEPTLNNEKENYALDGKRILLVDDNDLNIEIAQTLLEMNKMVVETAMDGKEAVDKFEENPPYYYDGILMDIRMPIMNGLEAAKYIRQLSREDAAKIPIVAMTANAFDEDMKKSIESGMNGHLSKPIDVNLLIDTLKQVMI